MIGLRRAESEADLEAWRSVRAAVLPNERAASVEEMRRMDTGDTVRLLAELDGEARRLWHRRRAPTWPAPGSWRRG